MSVHSLQSHRSGLQERADQNKLVMATIHRVRAAARLSGDLLSLHRVATLTGEEGSVCMAKSHHRYVWPRFRGSQESWTRGRPAICDYECIYYHALINNEAHASIPAQNFLIRVASHPILSRDEHFMGFLQQKDGWRESVKETGTLSLWDAKSAW